MKNYLCIPFFIIIALCFSTIAHAADFTLSPALIDAHGLPRDMMNYSITITNTSDRMQYVFPVINELTKDGKQVFQDPTNSAREALLVDWMTVTRASLVFQPGETKTIPVGITIHPSAVTGEYHAVIAFAEGGTRDDAEKHMDGAPQVIINMTVDSNAKEDLQLLSFKTVKRFYSTFPVQISYEIENIGNVPSVPNGQVIFYDRQGREVGSVDANPDGVAVAPQQKHTFLVPWQNGGGLGQYKASLDLRYGPLDSTLQDVAMFWILPWLKLLIIFMVLLVIMVVLAVFLHREYERRHHRRMLAVEHLLKTRSVLDLRHPTNRHD